MNDVKLRDKRKPGHCWQDNELYDAFGPVIGPNAILVYVQMSRNCYGTEIRSSSRELARDSGLSKDTVLRAMRVMERVGMVRVVDGGSRRVGEWHLVDLKELAIYHGGVYDPRRASYVLTPAKTAELRQAVKSTLAVMRGEMDESSVPVGDRLAAAPVPSPETELSPQTPTTVSGEARPYTRQQNLQDNPPTPQRGANDPACDSRMVAQARIGNLRQRLQAAERGSTGYFEIAFALKAAERELQRLEGNAAPPVEPVHDPPRVRRRRGPSDGCSTGVSA